MQPIKAALWSINFLSCKNMKWIFHSGVDFAMDLARYFIKPLDPVFQPVVMKEIKKDQNHQQDGHYSE